MHDVGDLALWTAKEQMEVRGEHAVGMNLDSSRSHFAGHAGQEHANVPGMLEQRPSCQPTVHDVVPVARAIDP
jgi:hypothetical protein